MNVVVNFNSFSGFFRKLFKIYSLFLTFNSGLESSLLKMFIKPKPSKENFKTFNISNII